MLPVARAGSTGVGLDATHDPERAAAPRVAVRAGEGGRHEQSDTRAEGQQREPESAAHCTDARSVRWKSGSARDYPGGCSWASPDPAETGRRGRARFTPVSSVSTAFVDGSRRESEAASAARDPDGPVLVDGYGARALPRPGSEPTIDTLRGSMRHNRALDSPTNQTASRPTAIEEVRRLAHPTPPTRSQAPGPCASRASLTPSGPPSQTASPSTAIDDEAPRPSASSLAPTRFRIDRW